MTVVVDPAHFSVFADYTVFGMIEFFLAVLDLFTDSIFDVLIIVGMHHALECITSHGFEILKIVTPVNIDDRLIDIQKFFIALRLVYEETARHVTADIFNDRHCSFI